jgi:selenocysteine lyase/cysteine desulfurase
MLSCQRQLFQLPDGHHYLNCAYMSPLPRASEEAGFEAIRRKRNPAGIGPEDFFRDGDELRRLFATLINADADRIALMPAASYGVATAVRNLEIGPGRTVVMAGEQFPGNVYGWRSAVAREGGAVRFVAPPGGDRRGEDWNVRLLEAIDASTAVVALGNVHWTDGTIFDLESIGRRAREVGAALIVDGTQSVGAMPFDVKRIRPDLMVCASYKWLLGPYSLAACYLGPRFDDGIPLEETWIARRGSEDFKGLVEYEDEYQPGAVRYDVGERSNFFLLPIQIASLRQVLEWTPEGITRYARELCRDMLSEATELGYSLEDERWRSAHLFGIRMPADLDLVAVREALSSRDISVSLRGSSLRVSAHVFNDEGDVEALLAVLKEVRR